VASADLRSDAPDEIGALALAPSSFGPFSDVLVANFGTGRIGA
jgi:hypothetical protein